MSDGCNHRSGWDLYDGTCKGCGTLGGTLYDEVRKEAEGYKARIAELEGRIDLDELAKGWSWLSGTLDDGTYRVMMYRHGTGLFEEIPLVGDGQSLDEALRAALREGEKG